jgi:hypothetical protein
MVDIWVPFSFGSHTAFVDLMVELFLARMSFPYFPLCSGLIVIAFSLDMMRKTGVNVTRS